MKSKKSLAMMEALVSLALVLILFLILAYIVPRLLGKEGAQVSDFIGQTADSDGDGIADFFDKCNCLFGDNDGCPSNKPLEGSGAIRREEECKNCIAMALEGEKDITACLK